VLRDDRLGEALTMAKDNKSPEKDDGSLEPEDFPVRTEDKKIVKNDGETIAEARNEKIADEVAERLNAEESIREEDRWSA
jgi:hypothetical protein